MADRQDKSEAAAREEEVFALWESEQTFEASLQKDAPNGEFVFYDGPPFATGVPHYGHILASTIKDAIPRYKTMQGYRVRRTWGWDCHGLPLENIIEKKLGLQTKRDIEALGVEAFNEAARNAVMEYADEWKRVIPRIGRWADMEDDYKTMDASYTESVWWAFKELDKKGLVYEGFKSMHLCPRCGTTLSNFEVNLGYKDIKDIAVTVKLPLVDEPDTSLLVWTTTPWTLPGNMAAAVHRDHDYVVVNVGREDGNTEKVILAEKRLAQLGTDEYEVVRTLKGSELVGKAYEPPFAYFKDRELEHKEHAWKIYHADYVELGEEGTGAVHLAPAYGEEDMALAREHNIPIVHHVGTDGRFLDFVEDFRGQLVKPKDDPDAGVLHLDADIAVVKALAAKGTLFRKENVTHSYPHCWRCDTPLLNYATTSWFVRVTEIKDTLVAENEKVHWVPEHVGRARFGDWLKNARDWAVSRQRYWGAPLPVWRNPNTRQHHIMGSLAELKRYVKRSGNQYRVMRHGEAEHNVADIFSSTLSAPYHLTETGKRQCRDAAAKLADASITTIYSSPFPRCRESAEMVAEALGLGAEAVVIDERLGELNFGVYSDQPSSMYGAWEERTDDWFADAPEGGESQKEVKRRFGEFLYELESTLRDERVLIVTHSIGLKSLQMVAEGVDDERAKVHAQEHTKPGDVETLDFVPLPHNREYELDFHRPYIDEIELGDGDGTTLARVPDVFDCWFESGAMPFAQQHYPFEHTDVFEPRPGFLRSRRGYPADFIAESIDQTRGWFYSLIVLGTALFGRSPYNNVITNGLVLAEDGKKMSKSLKNYPDPMLMVDKYGADTIRFYLLASPIIKGEDLNFSENGVGELARKNIGRLHNVLSFYELYADEAVMPSDDSAHVLDQWIRARLGELVTETTVGFESYELDRATRPVTDFIDDLSVWYLRRSRDRVKGSDEADRCAALGTLRYVLLTLSRVIAPTMPFYAEHLYRRVRTDGAPQSVHLTSWPTAPAIDRAVIEEMQRTRHIVSLALEARAKANVPVRQPLATLTTTHEVRDDAAAYHALILDEVNVKALVQDASLAQEVVLDLTLTPALRAEGAARELMRSIQELRKAHGLLPQDRIHIALKTTPEGEAVIGAHREELMQTVGADALSLDATEGETVSIGDTEYRIHIQKH